MTEDEARDWLASHFAPAQVLKLERFVAMLREESERQSLIARSTFDKIWSRHIVNSAQLVVVGSHRGAWLDIGSGGGLPGIVIAILRDAPITLCEPRRKRADFLAEAASALGLQLASVEQAKVQSLAPSFAVISARAVSTVDDIFDWTASIVSRETAYLLQRGKNWKEDVAVAQQRWHGAFHVEPSITDPTAAIVVASDVRRK